MNSQPLLPDMSNKASFVNGLFSAKVRDPASLRDAISAGVLFYCYTDGSSRGLILRSWLAAWQAYAGDPCDPMALERCPTQDRSLIEFLAGYLRGNSLTLCTPTLKFSHTNPAGLAVYGNSGYQRQPFLQDGGWLYGSVDEQGNVVSERSVSTVALFLELLFYGAHIVAISSDEDRGAGVENLKSALSESMLSTGVDPINSHYGASAIMSGLYYTPEGAPFSLLGDIESLATSNPPGQEPLLFSCLFGQTASTHANTFLQVEGWPSQKAINPPGGQRHNADYLANQQTLWNFSTYGASVFSEKRSTPVFLANEAFDLTLHSNTGMPYYWGANAGNAGAKWMHPDLVLLPPPGAQNTQESGTRVGDVNPIALIRSEPHPQPGQRHRSSGNFSIETAPPGTEQVQWFIGEHPNIQSITFDVMKDKSKLPDPTIFEGLRDGSITPYEASRSYYIANPAGADDRTFVVSVWRYPPE